MKPNPLDQTQESNKYQLITILQNVFVTMKTFIQLKNNLIDYQVVSASQIIQQLSIQDSSLLFQNIINDELVAKKAPQCPCFPLNEQKSFQLLFVGEVQINHLPKNRKSMRFVPHTISKFDYHRIEDNSGLLEYCLQRRVYALINSNPLINQQFGFNLNCGSRLKLGKIQIDVLSICLQSSTQKKLLQTKIKKILNEKPSQDKFDKKNQCRICLSADEQQDNPLLSICLCRGTSQYIHLKCIRNQISCKAIQTKQKVKICHISKVCCSICQYSLPREIQANGNKFQLINLTSTQSFIVLQTKKKDKKLILIELEENKPISIGRNQLCDIKLVDSSISRSHAQIYLENKQVKILDLKSKFGTLLALDKKIELQQQVQLTLQSRKSIFSFKISAQDR